jgi:hypothetical protein
MSKDLEETMESWFLIFVVRTRKDRRRTREAMRHGK